MNAGYKRPYHLRHTTVMFSEREVRKAKSRCLHGSWCQQGGGRGRVHVHFIFILHGSTSRRPIGPSGVVLFGLPTQCYLISALHKRCHYICACVTCLLRLDVSVIGWGFAWRREDVHYSSRFTTVCIEDSPQMHTLYVLRGVILL